MNPSAGWHTGGRWIGRQPVVSLGILILAGTAVAAAEPSPREIRQQIDAVDRLLATGKPEEAAASLASAIEGLEVLAAQPQSSNGLKFLSDRARRAVGKLDKAGIDVSRLSVAEPEQLERGRPPAARPAAAAGVSFSQQIAPFLAATCGRCHVAGRKGGFQMASYDQLMRSAKVSPGMGRQSELVEVILSGEMMLRHLGWNEAADLMIKGVEGAISAKTVTYDFERLMEGAKLLKCSEFGEAIVKHMG